MSGNRKYALIGATRPNFVKLAPLVRACRAAGLDICVINAAQHFDAAMSTNFLQEFDVTVDITLTPVHEPVVAQMADIMRQLEQVFLQQHITDVVVMGDVNATLAAGIAALKSKLRLIHIEAGLRSRNYEMPEELNRILVDQMADLLFTPSTDATENLRRENIRGQVHEVGNIMIDNVFYYADKIEKIDQKYYFCTLHRGESVDYQERLETIIRALSEIKNRSGLPIYLPLHPRTAKRVEEFGFKEKMQEVFTLLPPLTYQQSLGYQKNAELILTDSGGVQEEAVVLGVPCLTLRKETERPITVTHGTNIVAGTSYESIVAAYDTVSFGHKSVSIPLWDGQTAERIVAILKQV
jgi:UDP-N-acetylglucosamine 2-epimerase (non-hydrolysing)